MIRSANQGSTRAKRKKQSSKVQKQKGAKARPKAKKLSKAARGKPAAKRAVARAKPKRAPLKKAARPVAPAVETVAVEVIEQPAPGVITVTEVEEPEVRHARHQGPRRPHSAPQCARSLSTTQPYKSALVQLVYCIYFNKIKYLYYKQRSAYVSSSGRYI